MDALIFSGGIGEHFPFIRQKVVEGTSWNALKVDEALNSSATDLKAGEIRLISASSSSIPIYVISTDENYAIAQEVIHF